MKDHPTWRCPLWHLWATDIWKLEGHAGCYHCMTVFFSFLLFPRPPMLISMRQKTWLNQRFSWCTTTNLKLVWERMMWPERFFFLFRGQNFPLSPCFCHFLGWKGAWAAAALWTGTQFRSRENLWSESLEVEELGYSTVLLCLCGPSLILPNVISVSLSV